MRSECIFFANEPIIYTLVIATIIATGCFLISWFCVLNKDIAAILMSVATMIITAAFALYGYIFLVKMAPKVVKTVQSPDNSHSIVILEGGYIDAQNTAELKLNSLMYRKGDGYIMHHDRWGTSDINLIVTWVSEAEAHVTIVWNGSPANGSNKDDTIVIKSK